jgi:predicted nucleic acid-binding protein
VILDTNGLSAVADGAALEPILRKAAEVAVPVIVLGEYRYGIQQSRDRQRYEQWLTETICNYRVLDVDEETVNSYAIIRTELESRNTNSFQRGLDCRTLQSAFFLPPKPRPLRSCSRNRADRSVTLRNRTNALVHPADRLVGVFYLKRFEWLSPSAPTRRCQLRIAQTVRTADRSCSRNHL